MSNHNSGTEARKHETTSVVELVKTNASTKPSSVEEIATRLATEKHRLLKQQPGTTDHRVRWNRWAREALETERALKASDLVFENDSTAWDFATNITVTGREYQEKCDYSGYTFPGTLVFRGTIFNRLDFSNAYFWGNVEFSRLPAKEKNTDLAIYGEWEPVTRFKYESRFSGAKFHGTAVFSECEFTGHAYFDNCVFGKSDFSKITFNRTSIFANSIFDGQSDFSETVFLGNKVPKNGANFESVQFRKHATFVRATFGEPSTRTGRTSTDAIFLYGKFSEGVDFTETVFHGKANWNHAYICGVSIFEETKFADDVDFSDSVLASSPGARFDASLAKFEQSIRMTRMRSSIPITFRSAQLSGDLRMDGAIFEYVEISKTEPTPTLCFDNVQFDGHGVASFEHLTVNGTASIRAANFSKSSNFSHLHVLGDLDFSETQWSRPTHFVNVHIDSDAKFINSHFSDVNFTGSTFGRDSNGLNALSHRHPLVDFSRARFLAAVQFDNTNFHSDPRFRGSIFDASVDLDQATFNRVVPDFSLTKFEITPPLGKIAYKPDLEANLTMFGAVNSNLTALPERLSTLRSIAIRGHDVDRKRFYSKLEMHATPDRGWLDHIVERSYQLVADTGQSFLRPFSILVLLSFLVFPALYLAVSSSEYPTKLTGEGERLSTRTLTAAEPDTWQDSANRLWTHTPSSLRKWFYLRCAETGAQTTPLVSAFYLSIRNTIIIHPADEGAVNTANGCLYANRAVGSNGFWIRAIPFLQNIASIILIFLAAVGIRHRLRIDSGGEA